MERRISPLFGVFSKNPLQVQLFSHQAQYKVHQMPRWYPIQHRWRHQLILFWNPISKCLRHAPIQCLSTVKYGPHYLDRLHAGDMEFLTGICTYIGLALHNAWIHHQLLESKKAEEELRLVRERLAHSEKLSAMGELVAGIIHEMKNPLSVALGQCTLLRADSESNPMIVGRTDKVENYINEALKVAKNFLNFARAVGHDRIPIDLNAIIRQTVDLLAYEFRTRSVTVALDLQQLPLVRVDAGSMQQVLLNLLKNAQHAASENKNGVNVSVRSFCNKEKNVIRIEIIDNGSGISDEIQGRVFDAFFTTKTRDLGTGLGLPVSKRIVEEHSGTLSFESTPGTGTTFTIELNAIPNVSTADGTLHM